MRSLVRIFLFISMACIAAACASPTPAPTATQPAILEPTSTPSPTRTPLPTLTPWSSPTPTATQTSLPTATFPPTPDPALAKIKLIGLSWINNYDLLISFEFPGPVDPTKYRVTLEDKEYKCETIANYPNRLYCYGQGAKVLAVATIRVYPLGSSTAGFEKEVWVPFFDNNYNSP